METLEAVIRDGNINDDKLLKFNIERVKSYFLFDESLHKYIDEIYEKLIDLPEMNSATQEEKAKMLKSGELRLKSSLSLKSK